MSEVENAVITTAELAKRLGIQPGTLRNLKSKYRDRFIEGEHFVGTESGNLWTIAGEALIRELTGVTGASDSPVTGDDRLNDTPITESITGVSLDDLLQAPADAVAFHLIESRFPSLVHASLNRILTDPTDEDAQRLAEVFDRMSQNLGLLKISSAFAGGLRQALKASAQSLQAAGLPVPSSSAHLLEGGSDET